jgi:transposase
VKLAELYRAGILTAVWVPDAAHEALRDLVRARTAAKKDETRAKHRLTKYLLRYGLRYPDRQVPCLDSPLVALGAGPDVRARGAGHRTR